MSLEIEAKMKLADPDALEQQLRALGAQRCSEVIETNTFFDTPDHALRSHDRGLRLRVAIDPQADTRKVVITHKGPRAPGLLKTRAEHELTIFPPETAENASALLQALGMSPQFTFEKRRRSWRYENCLIEIDTVAYLGHFVEIEGPDESTIMRIRDQLGMHDVALETSSYAALLQRYLTQHDINTNHVRLSDSHNPCEG